MTIIMPKCAFGFAAGRGSRIADHIDPLGIPKPMIEVGGSTVIDQILNRLAQSGIQDVTINLHHCAAKLQNHLAGRTDLRLTFSLESQLLDTGGGLKKALYTMNGEPFFAFSGDTLWEDGPSGNALERLAAAWDSDTMDLLLLLQPVENMTITSGSGDYRLDADGKPIRAIDKKGDYFWPGLRIVHPRLFDGETREVFSFLDLMDRAEKNGRLAAIIHDGICHHISTARDLEAVNDYISHLSDSPKVA